MAILFFRTATVLASLCLYAKFITRLLSLTNTLTPDLAAITYLPSLTISSHVGLTPPTSTNSLVRHPCSTEAAKYSCLPPGNSGGPVFDGLTGKVVGHTVSTQSAVSESSITDIENWEREFLINSPNYKKASELINPYLARKHPHDPTYRIHPKFHRTLSGEPGGGALFLNMTFVCPGDVGPNGVLQPPDTHQAVFNRHRWDSRDVVFRNLTGRIDRIYIFTRPLSVLVAECMYHLISCFLLTALTPRTLGSIPYSQAILTSQRIPIPTKPPRPQPPPHLPLPSSNFLLHHKKN